MSMYLSLWMNPSFGKYHEIVFVLGHYRSCHNAMLLFIILESTIAIGQQVLDVEPPCWLVSAMILFLYLLSPFASMILTCHSSYMYFSKVEWLESCWWGSLLSSWKWCQFNMDDLVCVEWMLCYASTMRTSWLVSALFESTCTLCCIIHQGRGGHIIVLWFRVLELCLVASSFKHA